MKVVERAVAHGTATIPSDGRVGIDLPVVPLGRCFEIEEIGNGGRILHGAEVMGCAAPLGGVARTADAAHIAKPWYTYSTCQATELLRLFHDNVTPLESTLEVTRLLGRWHSGIISTATLSR